MQRHPSPRAAGCCVAPRSLVRARRSGCSEQGLGGVAKAHARPPPPQPSISSVRIRARNVPTNSYRCRPCGCSELDRLLVGGPDLNAALDVCFDAQFSWSVSGSLSPLGLLVMTGGDGGGGGGGGGEGSDGGGGAGDDGGEGEGEGAVEARAERWRRRRHEQTVHILEDKR
jgi:hypothetical protein